MKDACDLYRNDPAYRAATIERARASKARLLAADPEYARLFSLRTMITRCSAQARKHRHVIAWRSARLDATAERITALKGERDAITQRIKWRKEMEE